MFFSISRKYASNISSLTGAVLNLISILVLGRIYEKIAYILTEWGKKNNQKKIMSEKQWDNLHDFCVLFCLYLEMHETQTEFENHLTFKVFVFEFVNFYSSIFYIAFFKGKFIGYPGLNISKLSIKKWTWKKKCSLISLFFCLFVCLYMICTGNYSTLFGYRQEDVNTTFKDLLL